MKPQLQTQQTIQGLSDFISVPLEQKLQHYDHDQIEVTIINLFQNVAANVPAYQEFLTTAGIKSDTIQTLADFQKLPKINKENY
ncbi:MAG: phenylacetate--CoA ligase family protein, partial [Aphanizomenon sp.]